MDARAAREQVRSALEARERELSALEARERELSALEACEREDAEHASVQRSALESRERDDAARRTRGEAACVVQRDALEREVQQARRQPWQRAGPGYGQDTHRPMGGLSPYAGPPRPSGLSAAEEAHVDQMRRELGPIDPRRRRTHNAASEGESHVADDALGPAHPPLPPGGVREE